MKREPATHPKFAGNPGDSDRLACEPYHRGDGTVHLGLPSQCSEGPCSLESNRKHRCGETRAKLNLSSLIYLFVAFGFRCAWQLRLFEMSVRFVDKATKGVFGAR